MHPPGQPRRAQWLIVACGVAGAMVGLWLASGPVSQRLTAWHWQARLAEAPDEGVELPLRELTRCGPAGLQTVVEELDSPRRHRAVAAERTLALHIHTCEQLDQAEASAERLLLAQSLAESMERFDPPARRAAGNLATRLLATTRREKPEARAELILACEQVLRQVRVATGQSSEISPARFANELTSDTHRFDSEVLETSHAPAGLAGGGMPIDPAKGLVLTPDEGAAEAEVAVAEHASVVLPAPPAALPDVSEPNALRQSAASALNLPATTNPEEVPSARALSSVDDLPTAAVQTLTPKGTDTLSVVADLRSTDPQTAKQAEEKLKRRGLSPLELQLARALTDPEVQARERLAYALPSLPGVDARPWLAWLSQDPSPVVRTAAYSVMATVPDPELLARLAEAAQSDADPAIRSLASALVRKRRR